MASPAAAARIGIYFGTFDPPHNGHLAVVSAAQQELHLDQVYMLPNYEPSHKPNASDFADRYQMVHLIALRHPEIQLLPSADFERAYAQNPKDYIGLLIEQIRKTKGPDNQYFHLVGMDSFNKMAQYGKLPTESENRIVAVLPREGYDMDDSPAIRSALKRRQVQVLQVKLKSMSSSFLRRAAQSGQWSELKGNLPDYVLDYVRQHGLYGTAPEPVNLKQLSAPQAYQTAPVQTKPLQPQEVTATEGFRAYSLEDFLDPATLSEPLSLDQDAYLQSKIPAPVYQLLSRTQTQLKIVGGLSTFQSSQTNGVTQWLKSPIGQDIEPVQSWVPERERIDVTYTLGYEHLPGSSAVVPTLIVSNVFGSDRLHHLLVQYARLLQGAGRSLKDMELYLPAHFDRLEAQLCQEALAELKPQSQSTVFIGYHGALNYILSDLQHYINTTGQIDLARLDLHQLDRFKDLEPTPLLHPPVQGEPYFPHWSYTLPTPQGPHQIVSFRNTYGSATATLLQTLIHKGFHSFVFFGNGGALNAQIQVNQIYAPSSFSFTGQTHHYPNLATAHYPEASLLKVRSILDETWPWLQSHRAYGLVDVENFDAAHTLSTQGPGSELHFYSGLLVTDRPGAKDITHKEEDAHVLIHAKRKFFFQALQDLVWIPAHKKSAAAVLLPLKPKSATQSKRQTSTASPAA